MENSTMAVEVCTVGCNVCENEFYEFDGCDLAKCPHCNADFFEARADVIHTKQVLIEINYATGEIRRK